MRYIKRPTKRQDVPLSDHRRVDLICRYLRLSYRHARRANLTPDRAAAFAVYKVHRMTEDDMFRLSVLPDGRRRVNGAYRTLD